jgi:hypothetical protein
MLALPARSSARGFAISSAGGPRSAPRRSAPSTPCTRRSCRRVMVASDGLPLLAGPARRAASSAPPGDTATRTVMFLPHLLVRESGPGPGRSSRRSCCSPPPTGAPLGEPANPGMSPNPVTAPWYFVGFQELLIHLHPVFSPSCCCRWPPVRSATRTAAVARPRRRTRRAPGSAPPHGRRSSAIAAAGVALIATPLLVLDERRVRRP